MCKVDHGLTGKSRYRSNWRGTLILQVEIHLEYPDNDGFDSRWSTMWRDATVKDLQTIEVNPILKCEQ